MLLFRQIFAQLAALVLEPDSLIMLGGVLLLVHWQYRWVAATEVELYGLAKNRPLPQTIDSLILGVVGGVGGSLLAGLGGIALVQPVGAPFSVIYLWPVAVALSLIHPRYICFAYAATLVGLSHLTFGWPAVHLPSLLKLVALLHLVESGLIAAGGAGCATPLLVGSRRGETVAAFQMRRFWPVPLILPVVFTGAGAPAAMLAPVVVLMGYGDLAIATPPQARAGRTAAQLMVYSLALLALALLGARWRAALWAGVLFSALAHEWLVLGNLRGQLDGVPFMQRPRRGVGVLDVLPGSPAAHAGLRTGSVILEVSGQPVSCRQDLHHALVDAPSYLRLVYKNGRLLETVRIHRPTEGLVSFGAILLPEPGDPPLVTLRPAAMGCLTRWLRRIFN